MPAGTAVLLCCSGSSGLLKVASETTELQLTS